MSNPAAPIMKSGMPTSARVSALNWSAWSSSAFCSWRMQRTRSSVFVDQSVSSKARRAATIAASTSAAVPSGAAPIVSPVAGLRIGNVAPPEPPTSLPSISCCGAGGRTTAVASLMPWPPTTS